MTSALLLAALLAASTAAAPAQAASAPISKDGVEITVLPQVGVGGGSAAVTEVGLDIEAKTADAATRLGFHSLRAVADIDCGKGANRFITAEAFDQAGLAGLGRARNVTGAWVQPSSDSYMAAVISRVCGAPATLAAASRPPPVVKEMAAAPPAPALPPPAPAPTAQPLPPAAAPAVPASPTPPLVVKFSGAPSGAAPPTAATPKPTAAPRPAAPLPPAVSTAPPPSGPLVVKFSGAPTGAAPASAASPPKVAGDRVAQVAASANVHDAEKALRELRPLIAPPLTTTIEQAVVGGAHVYRADVVGFGTAADAKAFCRSAAQWSKTCWVRAKSDAPPAKPAERLRAAKRAG